MGFWHVVRWILWSQYLVIWYGNLTEEFHTCSAFHNPSGTSYMVLHIFAFFFPLAIFLSKRAKEKPVILVIVASIILSSLFVERFLAVAHSMAWSTFPFGIMELLVSLAFAAGFALHGSVLYRWSPHPKESLNRKGTESAKKRLLFTSYYSRS